MLLGISEFTPPGVYRDYAPAAAHPSPGFPQDDDEQRKTYLDSGESHRKELLVRNRAIAVLAAIMGALVMAVFASPSASAATSTDSITIFGTIKNTDQKPVSGVKVGVTGKDFKGEGTTNAVGRWDVVVPTGGQYVVAVDESTLPDGVQITNGTSRTVNVFAGLGNKEVAFNTGVDTTVTESKLSQVLQLSVDGLLLGFVIALAAVGLSLIYGTTGLTNFSHGELVTMGAMFALWFTNGRGIPFVISVVLAVIVCGALGGVQDRILWRPLRKRGTGLVAMLVISIGLGIFLRNLFLFIAGGDTQIFAEYGGQAGLDIGPVSITPKALIGTAIAIVLLLATAYWLLRTRMGKASRAVADNPALASASGIDVERVINAIWILGAGLAAYGGVLYSMSNGVAFLEGFNILLLIFAAVTLGGLGTAFGALVGSLVVGLAINLSTLFIPTELKSVGVLAIMIVTLLVRPQGLLGRRERVG